MKKSKRAIAHLRTLTVPLLAVGLVIAGFSGLSAQDRLPHDVVSAARALLEWAADEKSAPGFDPEVKPTVLLRHVLAGPGGRAALEGLTFIHARTPPTACASDASYCAVDVPWAFQVDSLSIEAGAATFQLSRVEYGEDGRLSEVVRFAGRLPRTGATSWGEPIDVTESRLRFGRRHGR